MFDWALERDDVSITHPEELALKKVIEPSNIRPLVFMSELEKIQEENNELRLMLSGAALQIKMMQLESKKDYSSNFLPIETAPKDGMLFLSWRKHSKIPVLTKYSTEYDWFESEDGDHLYDLVMWMPMPTITEL